MNNKYNQLISSLSDKELLLNLLLTQIILLVISVFLGWAFFDHFSFFKHLDVNDYHIITIGVPSGIAVVIIDIVLMNLLPSSYYDDGGLNKRMFQKRPVLQILLLTALVAFSEELLFRGVIQTKVGLIAASIIFAIIHVRYLFNWYLFLNIILLSLLIGLIYEWTDNLAVTMMMHFIIDFFLGVYIRFSHTRSENKMDGDTP